MKKTIGILGGMGPKATVYLFDLITRFTRAEKDGSHIPVIIFSNPQIPDRTEAIIHNGPSPLPFLIEGARFLEKAGASFIIMPCITAHFYYPDIIKKIKIPFIHLLEETALYVERHNRELQRLGLMATTGTVETRIFQNHLGKIGKEIVIPDEKNQVKVMKSIYGSEGIKAGFTRKPKKILLEVVSHLSEEKGSQAVIAGCTEIPLALKQGDLTIPLIDPLKIIALAAIKEADGELTNDCKS